MGINERNNRCNLYRAAAEVAEHFRDSGDGIPDCVMELCFLAIMCANDDLKAESGAKGTGRNLTSVERAIMAAGRKLFYANHVTPMPVSAVRNEDGEPECEGFETWCGFSVHHLPADVCLSDFVEEYSAELVSDYTVKARAAIELLETEEALNEPR